MYIVALISVFCDLYIIIDAAIAMINLATKGMNAHFVVLINKSTTNIHPVIETFKYKAFANRIIHITNSRQNDILCNSKHTPAYAIEAAATLEKIIIIIIFTPFLM